jgi:nitroreductase
VSVPYEALMTLLRARRSCRAFAPRQLEEGMLESLEVAFERAPQAGSDRRLACRFITDSARLRELAEAGTQAFADFCASISSAFVREEMWRYGENFFWFGGAPALAVITCRKPPAFLRAAMGDKAALLWGGDLSGAMAAFALLLAAQTLGLGACCLTGPLSVWREMETRLDIPKQDQLVLLIALGYRKDST